MENPYQSPLADDSPLLPQVEVVFRKRWVGRDFEQVYRFESHISDLNVLTAKIVDYLQRHNTRLFSSSEGNLVFESRHRSRVWQLASPDERVHSHTVHVSLRKVPSGTVVTCRYQVRALIPSFLLPPHYLEKEVRELASECNT